MPARPKIFIAGETAPTPIDAYHGAYIPHVTGNVALKVLESAQGVRIISDVHPAALQLTGAMVRILFGELDTDGHFIPGYNKTTSRVGRVEGAFTGPGSELKVY